MEKPVVATTVANEGIGAIPGEHLILTDRPADMAAEILALFDDTARAAALGRAARRFVERHWTWEAHFMRLEAEMVRAIDGTARR
jgi:glycosyltransferase involved in cell wall biosynthesis